MKKALAVTLALLIALVAFMAPVSAACSDNYYPFVFVRGDQDVYLYNEDGSYTIPLDEDSDTLDAVKTQIVPILKDALTTGDWDTYCKNIVDMLAPTYADIAPDEKGNLPANTGLGPDTRDCLSKVTSEHYYHMGRTFMFYTDPRNAVVDSAAELNEYVETVKAKTGHDKVVLIANCAGANTAMAYLAKYASKDNFAGIHKLIINSGTMNGLSYAEAFLAGKLKLDDESLFTFVNSNDDVKNALDDDLYEWFDLLINSLYATLGLKASASLVNGLYEKVKDKAVAPFIQLYYGRCGTYLATVNNGFEDAINYIFPTQEEQERFSVIIDKAREYHEIQADMPALLKNVQASGTPVNLIVQYGYMGYPLGEDAMIVSDSQVVVPAASFGATASKLNGTLSDAYIAERTQAGFGAYISPDKQIDASTGLFPETTWYVKNANHVVINESIARLMLTISRADMSFDIHSSATYSQFLNLVDPDGDLQHCKEVNDNDINWAENSKAEVGSSAKLLDKIIAVFRNLIQIIRDAITAIVNAARQPA